MNKTFMKNLIAGIIWFIASYIASVETANLVYIAVYTGFYCVYYFGKNYVFPSKAPLGFINVWDLLSGVLVAIGSAGASLAAQWITATVIDWQLLWITVYTTALGYLASKFGFGEKTQNT